VPMRTERTVVAVFRDLSEAQAAAQELTTNAFAGDHIHLASEVAPAAGAERPPRPHPAGHQEGSVDQWLESLGAENEPQRQDYQNAIRAGKALVGVTTPEQMVDMAARILKHHSPEQILHPALERHTG
jgi:hypothetical protein